eukprot:gnl/Trimastix_PCT/2574.p1 GENE.gnl/Trimastix_PCT/2574~~gnl/Trimastix_PCT/2574.p1  ORF type:complete len:336 (-),score=88.54 gnl/Trimastix_PCT/2574:27-1010(-)
MEETRETEGRKRPRMDEEERGACPMCGRTFPLMELIAHAESCDGNPAPSPEIVTEAATPSDAMADEEYARRLQEEFNQAPRQYPCPLCNRDFVIDDMYILDECSHKFCRSCIVKYISSKIVTEMTVMCPIDGCTTQLSVRDMKQLLPQDTTKRSTPTTLDAALRPRAGTRRGIQRLMKELQHIKDNAAKTGIDADPVHDNLYLWEVRFSNFDATDSIAVDMRRARIGAITLQATFPHDFPHSPPFVRVLRPRFQFRTGHVTVGGSICFELLTQQGWTPAFNMESVLVSIRAAFIEGGARLDMSQRGDYDEREAIEAFNRLLRVHGWR